MTLAEKYIAHIEKCFEKAYAHESKITDEINAIPSMTGILTRHFYNNLLDFEDARYLEIGAWSGGSTSAALIGNKARVIVIENFSGFGGPRNEFLSNLKKYTGENGVTFLEEDCFKAPVDVLPKRNMYLFDADHSEQSQFDAINYFLPCLDEIFIYIADDWNFKPVRRGTERAIKKNKLEILYERKIRLTKNNEHTPPEEAKKDFWNGIGVFILKKSL